MTTTTRERFKYKLEEIQSNFLNYNGVHTKEYMYDFLITEPILDIIETIEKEAEERGAQRGREEMRKEIKVIENRIQEKIKDWGDTVKLFNDVKADTNFAQGHINGYTYSLHLISSL